MYHDPQTLQFIAHTKLLQPTIKEIQAKYASNPEIMNQKIAEVYQTSGTNPLDGCLPVLVQLPVFLGLYRAVSTLAKENELNEPFLWLPNLEGPTYGADPSQGTQWITSGWYVVYQVFILYSICQFVTLYTFFFS